MQRAPSQAALKKPKVSVARVDVDSELEKALLAACVEGDVDRVRHVADKLQRKQETTRADALEELFACAFARAAGANQVATMDLLLTMSDTFPTLESCVAALRFGVCRFERYFPAVAKDLRCCFALRYVGYAAVMCVERNSVNAMRFLLETELLDDGEVLRCYELTKQKAIRFDAPNPGAHRQMLLLLIAAFPSLLDVGCSSITCGESTTTTPSKERESARHLRALEVSLLYEYKLNHSMG